MTQPFTLGEQLAGQPTEVAASVAGHTGEHLHVRRRLLRWARMDALRGRDDDGGGG